MAKYEVLIKPSAVKEIEAISQKAPRRQLVQKIQQLSENPYPPGAKKLLGHWRGCYRIRQGAYRVIYFAENEQLVVCIVRVSHRKAAYLNY